MEIAMYRPSSARAGPSAQFNSDMAGGTMRGVHGPSSGGVFAARHEVDGTGNAQGQANGGGTLKAVTC